MSKRIRKPRPRKPLPHLPRGCPPVVGPAIMAHIVANPGASPNDVHAAIGGSLASIRRMIAQARCDGLLMSIGNNYQKLYFATHEAANQSTVRLRAYKGGATQRKISAVLETLPGGATPTQLRDAIGLNHNEVSNSINRMLATGQAVKLLSLRRFMYFSSVELMEAARPAVQAVWDAETAATRAGARVRNCARSAANYLRTRIVRVKVPKPPKVVRVKAVKPEKIARAPKVKVIKVKLPKVVKVAAPKPPKVVKVKPPKVVRVKAVKPPKPERVPKVKPEKVMRVKAVKVAAPLKASKPVKLATTQSAEWKAAKPHITAATIVTIYRSAYVPMPPPSRQFQHGHSGKFAP